MLNGTGNDSSYLSHIWEMALVGLASLALPFVSRKVSEFFNNTSLSYLKQKGAETYHSFSPQVEEIIGTGSATAHTALKVAIQGVICLNEFVATDPQLKDPSISIEKSRKRLSLHNLPFSNCVDFLAQEAAQAYINNSEEIKKQICQAIFDEDEVDVAAQVEDIPTIVAMVKNVPSDVKGHALGWFLSLSKQLIAQTIKANILHIAANLADEGYKKGYAFEDKKHNPFGRLLSVVGHCFMKYEEKLDGVTLLSKDEQEKGRQLIFNELSSDLIGTFFPKGKQDIQLFHPIIPCMTIIKELIWEKINEKLPILLERLYLEMRPLEEEYQNWKEEFNEEAYSFSADQLVDLPSNLLQHFIRGNRARSLNSWKPFIEETLKERKFSDEDVEEFSAYFIKYAKEFILTEDPILHRMGSFFERYFMERILYNLSQFRDEENPMPLYIVNQWIEGGLFSMISQSISGKVLADEDKVKAVNQFLTPFGLAQEASFPLPLTIKKKVWPAIQNLLKEKIPDAFFKALPKWLALKKREHNQKKLGAILEDSSLTKTISNVAKTLTDKVFGSIRLIPSIGKKINGSLPSLILSSEQESSIDEQWEDFLNNDYILESLKNFGNQCVEAALLQTATNLYKNYQKSCSDLGELHAFKFSQLLFTEMDESVETEENPLPESLPFFTWFLTEIAKGCELLVVEGSVEEELKALQRAIELKNATRDVEDKNTEQAMQDQAELDALWIEIQPKFDHLSMHMLKIMGYNEASDIPFPKEVQQSIWKILVKKIPYLLFEQTSDFLLPLLDKKKLQTEIEKLPNGFVVKQSCQLLAQDVVNHLPEWLENKLKELPEKITSDQSDINLSPKARDYVVDHLQKIVKGTDEAYKAVWKLLESYLEGIFLKAASQLAKMEKGHFDQLFTSVQQTKNQLKVLEQLEEQGKSKPEDKAISEEKILLQFTDQLFGLLNITLEKDLWGIPQLLQETVLKAIKIQAAKLFLGIYHTEHKIRHHIVKANAIEEHVPTAKLSKAVRAVTQFALSKMTFEPNQIIDGNVRGVSQIYHSLNLWIEKQEKKNYTSIPLFKEVIAKGILTPSLIQLLGQLEIPSHETYKQDVVEWANPILTDQVLYHLTNLLEKEKKGKTVFDQSILMALLPVLKHHLKKLNEASLLPGGLNAKNDVDVPGDEEDKSQKQDLFYKNQARLLFQLIFPNGKTDLASFLPDVELSDDQFAKVEENVTIVIAEQLPLAIEAIFDKETVVFAFISCFETAIETLDLPIDLDVPPKPVLTSAELLQQKEMNQQIGQLIIEIAKFIELPIGLLEKMPVWLKTGIENRAFEAIGEKVRERFNGHFFETQIPIILSNMEKRKFEKLTPEGRMEALHQAELDLSELERKFVQKSVEFFIRYWSASLAKAIDMSPHPIMKFFGKIIFSISSFVMVNVWGSVLRFLNIDKWCVNSLHAIIHHRMQKTQAVFSEPLFHEDFVFQGVEALESVLLKKDIE